MVAKTRKEFVSLYSLRLLIQELRPQVLEQEGLLGALHARLDAVEKRDGIETRLIAVFQRVSASSLPKSSSGICCATRPAFV